MCLWCCLLKLLWQGPPKSAAKLSAARKAVGFDRTVDGRVTLFSDDGEPFQVKNDMGVPGALLLRWAPMCVVCLWCCFAASLCVLLYVSLAAVLLVWQALLAAKCRCTVCLARLCVFLVGHTL